MDPIEILVDDLGRQVAQKAIELADWRARAIVAERRLQELAELAEAGDDADVLELVKNEEGDTE